MKSLLIVLVVLASVVLLVGALNHETVVSFSYLAGETPSVSLAWVALGVATALVLAGVVGWAVAATAARGARRKLERELEATYRRLRECEARLSAVLAAPSSAGTSLPSAPSGDGVVAQPAPSASVTAAEATPDAAVSGARPVADGTAAEVRPAADAGADDGRTGPGGAGADD